MTRYSVSLGSWPGTSCPSGSFFVRLAQRADDLGFHGIYVGDHLQIEAPIPEAVATLALMGAVTKRIRLGPMVLLRAMRPLALTAKQLASLDHLTDGRLTVGIGVGGESPAEWRAAGVPTVSRGRRTDAYLDVLPALIQGESVTRSGPYVDLQNVKLDPGAAQPGGPPIWIGGRSDAALARAGRHQGWCGYAESPRGFARKKEAIAVSGCAPDDYSYAIMVFTWVAERRELAADALRSGLRARYGDRMAEAADSLCAFGTADDVRTKVSEYVAAGATEVILAPLCPEAEWEDQLTGLAEVFRPQHIASPR